MPELKIVNYHYVRPLKNRWFPNIKGIDIIDFRAHLQYFSKNYNFVSSDQIIRSFQGKSLPENPLWITFDDGLTDHYDYAMEELIKVGASASFFPSVNSIEHRTLLPVHAIQHILATGCDENLIAKNLKELCEDYGMSKNSIELMISNNDYYSRFDNFEVSFIKKALQKYIPEDIRALILMELFVRFVGQDSATFGDELYLSRTEIKEMLRLGMTIGGHGCEHLWHGNHNIATQLSEIQGSISFLKSFSSVAPLLYSYPFGSYNEITLKLMEKFNIALAVTTKPEVAILSDHNAHLLSRFDANDIKY